MFITGPAAFLINFCVGTLGEIVGIDNRWYLIDPAHFVLKLFFEMPVVVFIKIYCENSATHGL